MFKIKVSGNGSGKTSNPLRKSIDQSSEVIADKVSDGLKYAEDQVESLRRYIRDHHDIEKISENIQQPTRIAIATIGIGLLAYGIYSIFKK